MAYGRQPYRSSSRLLNIWSSQDAPQRLPSHRFDPDTGQVFTETVVNASLTSMDTASRLEAVFARIRQRSHKRGAPSLEDIAVRSFLRNVDAVTSETLVGLQWDIGVKLWKQVESLDLTRPSIWAAFAAAYPDEDQFRYYRASEITPQKTFAEYIDFLGCQNFEWLTCLTLSKIHMERADIMRVSELSNLVAMDIYSTAADYDLDHNPPIAVVDDQVVRNWGRRAQESGSFPKLRVLILRNQRHVTARSLEYLSAFPRLVLFGVSGCSVSARHGETALKQGWTLDDDHGILARINGDIDRSHTWDGALGACVKYSASILEPVHGTRDPDSPILSYRLGPTSSDVLYSVPLVFFRCIERKTARELFRQEAEVEGEIEAYAPAARQEGNSGVHLSKKRKIKVSAQRSFDSTLSELLGVDIVRSSMPAKPTSDTSIDMPTTAASQTDSPAKPSSTPATPNNALAKRRQARQERERPWRQSPGDKT